MKNFSNIKNVIFDLGGVLIDLLPQKTIDCFGANITAFYNRGENQTFVELAHKFERGEITSNDFRTGVSKIYGFNLSATKFDNCWNAMIGDFSPQRIKLLKLLRKKYRIFLLSNTNEIHYHYFTKQAYWDKNLFEKVYFSQIMKMRKPELRIFNYVLNDSNLKADETLFIDDNPDNVQAAQQIGIKAHHLTNEIIEFFEYEFKPENS